MRKISMLLLFIVMMIGVSATEFMNKPPLKASEIFIPVGKTGKMISLLELSTIKMKDFQILTEKKLGFFTKQSFKIAQRQLRNSIDYDGSLNSKKIETILKKKGDGGGFQAGGFFLGFFLGLLGVLIAFLINDDKKINRTKWAWVGFGVWIVTLLILIATSTGGYF